MHCCITSCIMSLHCILDSFIASLQCRLSCIHAICRMMHCCIVSCIMSLHCIHARNNRVLGHCRGKVSRIPGFQAVETSCLKIFIIICLLLSPSDPIDRSYFVPAYAVSFGVVHTGAGHILSKNRFRPPPLRESRKLPVGRIPAGSRILQAPSVRFRGNPLNFLFTSG